MSEKKLTGRQCRTGKCVLSLMLTVCLLLGMVPNMGIRSQAEGEKAAEKGMIYLEGNAEKIYQTVRLEQGKTYTFSYLYQFEKAIW